MIRTTLIAATLAVSFTEAHAAAPLQLKIYNADESSFSVNSTLIYGEKEAVVIDAGFTRADALRIAANVLDSQRRLTLIVVSQADPDYYFGVETLKEIFPDAKVVASPEVLEKLSAKMAGKVAYWSPKMGSNAPKKPVLPEAMRGNRLTVDGQAIELRGNSGLLAHRPYFWIPSIKAIVGNIGVFGGLHVWTADTQTLAERQAWIAQLDEMAALDPRIVVPGHMLPSSSIDIAAIGYTNDYLQRFEKNAAAAKNSAELIELMEKAYPDAPAGLALVIGAKVIKGEMKW